MKPGFIIAAITFLAISCGSPNDRSSNFSPPINVCDPELNSKACPLGLLEENRFSRTFTIGEDNAGIQVRKPTEEKIAQRCRSIKISYLAYHLEEKDTLGRGLYEGEYFANTEATVKEEGSICRKMNLFQKCTRYDPYVRVSCTFTVHTIANSEDI